MDGRARVATCLLEGTRGGRGVHAGDAGRYACFVRHLLVAESPRWVLVHLETVHLHEAAVLLQRVPASGARSAGVTKKGNDVHACTDMHSGGAARTGGRRG